MTLKETDFMVENIFRFLVKTQTTLYTSAGAELLS